MELELRTDPVERTTLPALAVFAFEDDPARSGTAASLPSQTQELLGQLKSSDELKGKTFDCVLLHRPQGLAAERLLVVGAGKREKFSGALERRLAGAATRYLRSRGIHEFGWVVGQERNSSSPAQAGSEGFLLGDFDVESYRTDEEAAKRYISRVVLFAGKGSDKKSIEEQITRGRVIGEARNWARELVNEPSNNLTPTILAEKAEAMANRYGLRVDVFGPKKIQALKMGAFYSVAQGSEEPPRLIVVNYEPEGAPEKPLIGLIGKGVTFDSGGISIKPSDSMHEMKTDMAGAATMLAVMQVIAQLKPRVRVIAIVPATENLPSGKAQKPGDIQVSMSGKTIEILNTDAEGRLLLADALTYARQLGCTHLLDAATLTGAVMIALGHITTGVFGWNQEWVDNVLQAARQAGEQFWQLPVDDEYRPQYKSMIADLANTGGRYGGAITAAMFVGEFAEGTPWAHLDIAGTRWTNDEKPYMAKGATGVGVPTLSDLLMNLGQ